MDQPVVKQRATDEDSPAMFEGISDHDKKSETANIGSVKSVTYLPHLLLLAGRTARARRPANGGITKNAIKRNRMLGFLLRTIMRHTKTATLRSGCRVSPHTYTPRMRFKRT